MIEETTGICKVCHQEALLGDGLCVACWDNDGKLPKGTPKPILLRPIPPIKAAFKSRTKICKLCNRHFPDKKSSVLCPRCAMGMPKFKGF